MNFLDKNPECDWLISHNAHILAKRIKDYWGRRGYKVNVRTERIADTDAFAIRSDLVNGLPPR